MKKFDLPFLQIEPSTTCNYTCGFCVGRHMDQNHIEIEIFRDVLKSVENLKYVSIQGEGEPLLNPYFFEMVKIARDLHPYVSISFITNGSLFSSKINKQILSSGIDRIMVSIESAKPELFREIRGGKLEKVISGIQSLMQERQRQKLNFPVIGFAVTLLKKTINDFSEIVKLYEELALDGGIATQYLQEMESYSNIYEREMKDQILSEKDIRDFEKFIANDQMMNKILGQANTDSNFYTSLFKSDPIGCPWLSNGLYVNKDGVASGCCQIKKVDQFGLGKLNLNTAGTVFEKREQMKQELYRGIIPMGCKKCPIAVKIQKGVLNLIK